MALGLIAATDFVGFLNIDFSQYEDFDTYSAQLEEMILTDLFGKAMYDDMVASPTEAEYVNLIDGTTELISLKVMMRGFFYFYFLADRQSHDTTIGEVMALAQNAEVNQPHINSKITARYNDGYNVYIAQSEYVKADTTTYTLYTSTVDKEYLNVLGI